MSSLKRYALTLSCILSSMLVNNEEAKGAPLLEVFSTGRSQAEPELEAEKAPYCLVTFNFSEQKKDSYLPLHSHLLDYCQIIKQLSKSSRTLNYSQSTHNDSSLFDDVTCEVPSFEEFIFGLNSLSLSEGNNTYILNEWSIQLARPESLLVHLSPKISKYPAGMVFELEVQNLLTSLNLNWLESFSQFMEYTFYHLGTTHGNLVHPQSLPIVSLTSKERLKFPYTSIDDIVRSKNR